MRKRDTITLAWLKRQHSCRPKPVEQFEKRFGKSAPTGNVLRAIYRLRRLTLLEQSIWAEWLLAKCLSPTQRLAWERAWQDPPFCDEAKCKCIDLQFINKAWPSKKGAKA